MFLGFTTNTIVELWLQLLVFINITTVPCFSDMCRSNTMVIQCFWTFTTVIPCFICSCTTEIQWFTIGHLLLLYINMYNGNTMPLGIYHSNIMFFYVYSSIAMVFGYLLQQYHVFFCMYSNTMIDGFWNVFWTVTSVIPCFWETYNGIL